MKESIKILMISILISCSNDNSQNFENEINSILGQWRLISIGSLENPNQFIEPDSEKGIFISFYEDESLKGSTSSNSFVGEYFNDDENVVIPELISTLANETEWGNLYKSILWNSSDENGQYIRFTFAIDKKQLVLRFKNRKIMTFQKVDNEI